MRARDHPPQQEPFPDDQHHLRFGLGLEIRTQYGGKGGSYIYHISEPSRNETNSIDKQHHVNLGLGVGSAVRTGFVLG